MRSPVPRTATSELVLSLFPGIGILDRAFEEQGFCVVRGPDLLWGGGLDLERSVPMTELKPFRETTCKGCGRKIAFGVTPEGKKIPLDLSAPVYGFSGDGAVFRAEGWYVSHFATCPKASSFCKGGSK